LVTALSDDEESEAKQACMSDCNNKGFALNNESQSDPPSVTESHRRLLHIFFLAVAGVCSCAEQIPFQCVKNGLV
jgi:hypothetical protein